MPLFEYRGLSRQGKNLKGVIDAENLRSARSRLKKDHIFVVDIRDRKKADTNRKKKTSNRGGVNVKDLALMTRQLATLIKALPITVRAARPIDEAISSAGGVRFEAMDHRLMLRALPGVFCAGEMLDWEAPTGGYLLTACFATGRAAGEGAAAWLGGR